jgi:hypothetical protein
MSIETKKVCYVYLIYYYIYLLYSSTIIYLLYYIEAYRNLVATCFDQNRPSSDKTHSTKTIRRVNATMRYLKINFILIIKTFK